MKRFLNSCLALATALTVCAGALIGCVPETPRDVNFYALEITDQPYLDTDLSDRGDGALQNVTMCLARNEHEFAQIVVSPKKDVSSLKMEISALTDGDGNVFDGDVTLYRAHYVQYCGDGIFRPTALIPLFDGSDGALATDIVSVNADENQAFYIELFSAETTKPGTYTGTVTFTYDGVTEQTDISVTVWDFVLPKTSSLPTSYGFWSSKVEEWYAAWYPDMTVDLDEVCNGYRDFLRSYRLNVDLNDGDYETADEWAAEIRREVDEGKLSVSQFLMWYAEENVWDNEKCAELNRERAEAVAKYDLFDHVWVYVVDEPYWPEHYAKANRIAEILDLVDPRLKQVVTTHYQEGLLENVEIWCPTDEWIDRDSVSEAHARGQEMWTYGLIDFSEENDTYDRYRLWAYESLHVDGYLVWMTDMLDQYIDNGAESDNYTVARDIWTQGSTWGDNDGQAVYFYPCTEQDGKVGRNIAIPTVDLFTDCTALEDYEYFTLLRDKYTALADELCVSADVDDVMNAYYAPVTSAPDKAVTSDDVTLGNRIRAMAAADILSDEKALLTVKHTVTKDGETVTVNVWAEQGAVVKDERGNVLTPVTVEGKAEMYEIVYGGETEEISVTVNGTKMTRVVAPLRDYDIYLSCVDMVRMCADTLGTGADVYEKELYDALMQSKYVMRTDEGVRAFAADLTALCVPMLYRTEDYVTAEDGLTYRSLYITVPNDVTVTADGRAMSVSTQNDTTVTYVTRVKCDELINTFAVALSYGDVTYETSVCVVQHARNGKMVVDVSSDTVREYADKTDGVTYTDEGLRLDVGMGGKQLVNLPKEVLLNTDLSDCNVLRLTVTNPTDVDQKGITVTSMFFFNTSASTGVIPAHGSVTLDINLNNVAVERRNALSKLVVSCDMEEDAGTYVIGDIYAFGVQ